MRGHGRGTSPGRTFTSAECLGAWSPSLEESNYVLRNWGASVFESVPGCPCVILGEWDWGRPCNCIALSLTHRLNNKRHFFFFWRVNYYWGFSLQIPFTCWKQHFIRCMLMLFLGSATCYSVGFAFWESHFVGVRYNSVSDNLLPPFNRKHKYRILDIRGSQAIASQKWPVN